MTGTVKNIITRGQIWMADLGKPIGSEQGGIRPVLVVQNEMGNRHSPTLTIVPLTSKQTKHKLPTHVILRNEIYLQQVSTALVEQIKTIDRGRLITMLGRTNDNIMIEIDEAIKVQTALKQKIKYEYAFNLLKQINDIKLEIKELGKRPRLMSIYQQQVLTFKEYCKDCNVDYKLILGKYNQQKYAEAL